MAFGFVFTVGDLKPSREGSLPASGIMFSLLLIDFFTEVWFRVTGSSIVGTVMGESDSISSLDKEILVRVPPGSSLVSILDLLGAGTVDTKRGLAGCFAFDADDVRLALKDNVPCLRDDCIFDLEEDIFEGDRRVKFKCNLTNQPGSAFQLQLQQELLT